MNQSITLSMSGVKKEFETLVWKYANSTEGEDNSKTVHNLKADRMDDTADALLVDNNFDKRLKEVASIMHDFSASISTSGDNVTISFVVTSRWSGTMDSLQSKAKTYILDGMMVDWLNVTAPSEAAIYVARLQQDVTDINVELYAKGVPQ